MSHLRKAVALVVAVAATAPAYAQGIPVHDTMQYLQIVQQVTNSATQIEKAIAQIQQLQKTYESLSKITNAASVASLLNTATVRNLLPTEASTMAALLSGNTSTTGAIGTFARRYQDQYGLPSKAQDGTTYSSSVNDAYGSYLRSINGGAANMLAIGSNTLDVASNRTAGLSDLQNQISSAKDPKDAMDLAVRASVENAQATNDLMKLRAIEMSQQAQSDMLLKRYWASRSRAANTVEHDAIAALTAK